MRNHGVCLAYSLVGYKSLLKGLDKVSPNYEVILSDLNNVKLINNNSLALGSAGWTNSISYEKIWNWEFIWEIKGNYKGIEDY